MADIKKLKRDAAIVAGCWSLATSDCSLVMGR